MCAHTHAHTRARARTQPPQTTGPVARRRGAGCLATEASLFQSCLGRDVVCRRGDRLLSWMHCRRMMPPPPRPPRPTTPHSVIFQKNQGFHLLSPWNSILSLSLLMILEPTAVIIFCPRTNKKVTWHLKANTHSHAALGKENIGTQTAK